MSESTPTPEEANNDAAGVEYGAFDRNEPAQLEDAGKIEISAKGVQAARAGDFRKIVNERFPDWNTVHNKMACLGNNTASQNGLELRSTFEPVHKSSKSTDFPIKPAKRPNLYRKRPGRA